MRQALDLRAIVTDEHDAMPRQHLEADQLLDQRRRLRIERARRLVEQQHLRIVEQRTHEREALAFAGRQRRNRAIERVQSRSSDCMSRSRRGSGDGGRQARGVCAHHAGSAAQ